MENLTKSFGPVRAVDGVSFVARPGTVTGFLGPNGAGKTTTLRMILGLVGPTSGRALIEGKTYADLERPLATVGAALEATGFHPGRTARDHLRVTCLAAGLPLARVDAALAQAGLTDAAGRRVGGFSLGMRQRLALAAAILAEPPVLIMDEPANGLDPAGIHWLRAFLRHLAEQGCTVLLSSHVLAEVEQTADHIVIVANGRVVRDASVAELTGAGRLRVRIAPQDAEAPGTLAGLAAALERTGAEVEHDDGGLVVAGVEPADVGRAALATETVLTELAPESSGLEKIFLELTMAQMSVPEENPA